ncbi:MAG: hypothetical protein ONB44_09430 [candidate division KSB1 bacterium]|nr:hypothetical protein [candidate division KSB1 bacterium]MDZ7302350.1 hypothetical protein [candidate division KSB1 bacterium]MDZ7311202.1 hypothetical protein [candidate division KSB1 bacterium]
MEISDEKLRQIVRETLLELGPHADPALVNKIVREIVRRLLEHNSTPISATPSDHKLLPNTPHSAEASASGASRQEY